MTSTSGKSPPPAPAHVRTLRDAQEWLTGQWPGRHPSTSVLLAYHRKAAMLYDHVARADPAHHHEAPFWAAQEREAARALTAPITAATR